MSETVVVSFDFPGVQEGERAVKMLSALQSTLQAGKGSGKALEEMRKAMLGLRGQASVFQELRDAAQGMNTGMEAMKKSFSSSIRDLGRILKQEMGELRAVMQTSGALVGQSAGAGMAKAMEQASTQGTKSLKSKMKRDLQEMQAALESELAKGVKFSAKDFGDFKAWGLNIGMDAKQGIREGLISERGRGSAIDVRTILGLTDARMKGSAKESADVFKAAFVQQAADAKTAAVKAAAEIKTAFNNSLIQGRGASPDVRTLLGLTPEAMGKSARDSAEVFKQAFSNAVLQGKGAAPDVRTLLGMTPDNVRKSARDSASVFKESFANEVLQGRGAAPDVRTLLGLASDSIAKSARDSAEVFKQSFANEVRQGKGAAPDVRTLLGLSAQAVQKSAKDSADVFKTAFANEAGRGRDTFRDFNRMLGLDNSQVAKSARESAAVYNAAFAAEQKKFNSGIRNQVQAATINPVGAYSNINTGQLMNMPKADEVDKLSGAFKRLTVDGNDAHSMARGLASGFNLLWLTWGNLLPLFTGAGISFGLKKTFDIGSEVEYNVKFMEVLGQTTKEQGTIIRQELRAIDQTTMFSLTELSKGMITLGQAGLSPKEALETLKPAADLAAAGMVDLDTATKLLIQTNALFGLSAKDTAKTAAQIFVATKSGVLNVEDIGGSMKYASEANTRFGKSLEETLALLGALAQAGIKGASGGTAYINFLRDLNGRSGPAIAALNQLNAVLEKQGKQKIEIFNNDGTQKDSITLMEGIAKAAGQLKSSEADKILAKLFSDRGGRTFFAMIREGTINLRDMVKELENVKPEVLLDAAKGMMDTTKGAVNILQGTLVGALDEVFELNAEKFKTFIKDITAVVSSNEFKNGVYGMVAAVGSLYETIKTLLPVLTALGTAWAVFKAAGIGVAIFQAVAVGLAGLVSLVPAFIAGTAAAARGTGLFTASLVANGTALIGQAAASRVATAGMTDVAAASARAAAASTATAAVSGRAMGAMAAGVALLANPITGIIVSLGLLGLAFWDANKSANAAMSSTTDGVLENGKVNMAQWDKEIQKLRDRNKLLGDSYSGSDNTIAKAREAQVERENRLKTMKSDYSKQFDGKIQGRPLMQAAAQDAVNKIDDLQREVIIESQLINKMQADVSLARVKADREKFNKEQKEKNRQNLLPPTGTGMEVPKAPGRGGFGGPTTDFQAFKVAQDNTLAELQKGVNARLTTYKTMYDQEKQLMDAEHNAKLMSEGTYQAKVFASTQSYEAQTLADLRQANSDIYDAYGERYDQLETMLNKAKAANKGGALDSVIDKLNQDLENLENTADNMVDGNLERMFQTQAVAANRFQLAAVSARGELAQLQKTSTDYWAKNGEELAKVKALDAINDQYEILNESVFSLDRASKAGAIAAVNELEKHREHIRSMEFELRRAELAYIDYGIAAMEAGPPTEAQVAELARMREKVKLLQDIRDSSIANANKSSDEASEAARNRQLKDQVAQFNKGLADAFETAIFEGGKEGAKKMRDFLQEELLRKPLRVILQGAINSFTGGLLNGGTGGGGGGFGSLVNGLSSILGGNSLPSAANPNSPDFVGPPAPEGAGNGAAGAMNNLSSLASIGQQAYNLYNGTGPIATAWKGISTWASSLSTTAAAATTATTAATTAGVVATPVYSATAVGTALPALGASAAPAAAASTAGSGFMGVATTNWVMMIMALIANAMGIFRSKKIIGAGLQGTLGGDKDLTSWEETRIGGTLFSGPDFETVDPLAQYEALRKNDLENIAKLKAQGGSATGVIMQPYDSANMGNTQMGDMSFREDMEERAWNLKGQSDTLQAGYKDFRDGIVKMANGLGLAGDSLKNFQFTLDQQDLNFKDLDDEEIQEKITAAYGKAGAEMLKGVMGTWITETVDVVNQTQLTQLTMASDATYDLQLETITRTRYVASEFAKGGETALDTLTRLSNSFHAVNNAADALGYGTFQASLGVAAAADKVVEAFGGLEAFMTTTSAFINNFFTSNQRKDATARQLSRDLEALGINVSEEQIKNTPREQMISSVLSLASDPKLQSDVMKLVNGAAVLWQVTEEAAPAVNNLATAADNAADALNQLYQDAIKSLTTEQMNLQIELARVLGNEPMARKLEKDLFMSAYSQLDAQRQAEIAVLYDLNRATKDLIESYKTMHASMRKIAETRINAAVDATDQAMAALERAVDAERKVLEEQQAKSEESVNNLQAIFDTLSEASKSLFATVTAAVEKQAIAGRKVLRDALATGVLPDQATLSDAIASARAGVEQEIYTSGADSDYARQVLAGELGQLAEVAGKQLTDAQLQLQTAKDGLKRLDGILEFARQEIDKLRNIDTGVGKVETAINNLAKALGVEFGVRTDVNKSLVLGTGNATYDLKSGTGTNDEGQYFTGADMLKAAKDTIDWGIATGNGWQASNQIYDVIAGSGFSVGQAEQILGMEPGSLKAEVEKMGLPVFHEGTNYVPREGLALLDQGEMVVPAEHNPWTNPDSGEEAALLREMVIILSQMNDGSNTTSMATQKMAKLLEDVTENGGAMRTVQES